MKSLNLIAGVPNHTLSLVYLNAEHVKTVRLLPGAPILTWAVLSQIVYCYFVLTESKQTVLLPLRQLFFFFLNGELQTDGKGSKDFFECAKYTI